MLFYNSNTNKYYQSLNDIPLINKYINNKNKPKNTYQ